MTQEQAVPLTDPMSKRSHRELRDVAEFSRKQGRKSIGLSPASLLSLLDEIDEAREAYEAGRDRLAMKAEEYIEAVVTYLDPANQFTYSRRRHVDRTGEELAELVAAALRSHTDG